MRYLNPWLQSPDYSGFDFDEDNQAPNRKDKVLSGDRLAHSDVFFHEATSKKRLTARENITTLKTYYANKVNPRLLGLKWVSKLPSMGLLMGDYQIYMDRNGKRRTQDVVVEFFSVKLKTPCHNRNFDESVGYKH